jgi:hypothetical protein
LLLRIKDLARKSISARNFQSLTTSCRATWLLLRLEILGLQLLLLVYLVPPSIPKNQTLMMLRAEMSFWKESVPGLNSNVNKMRSRGTSRVSWRPNLSPELWRILY